MWPFPARDFDLIIVDEGHYEPAISWSRAIREADRPTILFSATPYRNDYKSFRVRGRFVFNEPILSSIKKNKIRKPEFKGLTNVRVELGAEQSGTRVVSAGSGSEDTRRKEPLQDSDRADATAFVDDLISQKLPPLSEVVNPKIVIHASDFEKAELLQKSLVDRGERALLVHHAVNKNDPTRLRFNNVRAAQTSSDTNSVKYWVHQTKLLEGIDDPSIVAVALYDAFGKPPNLHLLSTVGMLRGLERVGVIRSADDIIQKMTHPTDPSRRARVLKDLPDGVDEPAIVGSSWTP